MPRFRATPVLLVLLSIAALLVLVVPGLAHALLTPYPSDVRVETVIVGGHARTRITWFQHSDANEVAITKVLPNATLMLVDYRRGQQAGANDLLDMEIAEPLASYMIHEFFRDGEGAITDYGSFGPFRLSDALDPVGTASALPTTPPMPSATPTPPPPPVWGDGPGATYRIALPYLTH